MSTALKPVIAEEIAPEGLDPTASFWVAASAGSGKTTLLVKRVLRLLLEREGKSRRDAPRILCLTYTRAAAAEMLARIQEKLIGWAIRGDEDLRDTLFEEFGLKADREKLKHARRLFGQTLERPEMVRVMTIHAFCQTVLNRFPLEAGVTPHFTLLEGDRLESFQGQVLEDFLRRMKQEPALKQAFDYVSARSGPSRLEETFAKLFFDQPQWAGFFDKYPAPEVYEAALLKLLNLQNGQDEAALLREFCQITAAHEKQLREALPILMQGGANEKKCAGKMRGWLEDVEQRPGNFEAYADAFLTKELQPRAKLLTKETEKNHPHLPPLMQQEAARVNDFMRQMLALRFYQWQAAWSRLFHGLWQAQRSLKASSGRMTYDDLILSTRALLQNPGVCSWVLYKLDGGINHLLVDEAQDTSPAQWDILFALLDEFLAGEGARQDVNRTVFVVGDEKQSIFSFQGANRDRYFEAKEELLARLKASQRKHAVIERHLSYRTAKSILAYVDALFANEEARAGVADHVVHESSRKKEPSYIELWPLIADVATPRPAPWTPPLRYEENKPAPVQLAEKIAATIKQWLEEGWFLASEKRAVQAGDVMILLQSRGKFLLPIVRALKDAHVPVAGIDRMEVAKQPAVQDVISLCRFLLLPRDNLALAEVLRGPLVRFSDEKLFKLAQGRGMKSLWESMQEKAPLDPAVDWLKHLLSITDYVPAFALLNEVLFRPCPADKTSGQHALVRRLGPDAVDPLEELLASALIHESEAPSLQLFVQSIGRSQQKKKRELSQAQGAVRVLTVHSAKGLESPIVFMPDLSRLPQDKPEQPKIFRHGDFPLVAGAEDDSIVPMEQAKSDAERAEEEEHRRLLYVALTRPRDVLILCGLGEKEKEGKENKETDAPWFQFCKKAMERLGAESKEGAFFYGEVAAFAPQKSPEKREKESAVAIPEWIRAPVKSADEKRRFVNPSQVAASNEKTLPPNLQQAAFRRGELLHRLLQMLPLAEPDAREELAKEFLRAQLDKPEAANEYAKEVMEVLNHPVFAPLFGPGSRAEVPVIGRVEGRRISGQIDRMAVTEHEVFIIDYKTNRPPPSRPEDVSKQYLAQMAAYRALLEKIYPGKRIRLALLWTFNLRLMELNDALYQQGLAILKGA
jgi:ATP-dependent helicase/nuclease subunit A